MKYNNVVKGIFIKRENRFIAKCLVNGEQVVAHVKNTGRCAELLIKGVAVYLVDHFLLGEENTKRKTRYSLIAVEKGDLLINIDSQAPNKVAYEGFSQNKINLPGFKTDEMIIKQEKVFGKSRFDFYLENQEQKAFLEVKGATLEEDGVVKFPDAPTIRGVKHIYELIEAKKQEYLAYVLFVVQMKGVIRFEPNKKMHSEFADALVEADKQGVKILCYDCLVTENKLEINQPVKVIL